MGLVGSYEPCPECGADELEDSGWLFATPMPVTCSECGYETTRPEVYQFNRTRPEILQDGKGIKTPKAKAEELRDEIFDNVDRMVRIKIKDKEAEGWRVLDFEDGGVVMGRPKGATIGKHAIVGILTFPLTLGLGNAAYHSWKKNIDLEKIVIRDKSTEIDTDAEENDSLKLLEQLNELMDEGVITEKEFEVKKKELLDEI